MIRALATWLLLLGLYLLFSGELSRTELIAGAATAAAATLFALLLHRAGTRRLALRAPWPRVLGTTLAALAADSVRVGASLLRAILRPPAGPLGTVSRQPFRAGEGPVDAGRRGVVELATSLAPNGYVLDLDEAGAVMLMHRLVPVLPRPDAEWPL